MKTVLIIGAGASGMIAALTATEKENQKVILLERQARVGRKLSATGNGRCNLTNTGATLQNYHGFDSDFAEPALKAFPPEEVMRWFSGLGLLSVETEGGRVYPLTDSANSVVDVLRFALQSRKNLELHTGCEIKKVLRKGEIFQVVAEDLTFTSDRLIIACGGKAGGKLGGVGDGYEFLRSFGHSATRLYPALVPVCTDTDLPRSLKGVRADASLCLLQKGRIVKQSEGELQFTERGISGPAAFDISREAAVGGGTVQIDLLREYIVSEIENRLKDRKKQNPELESQDLFAGILHHRLGTAVVKACGLKPSAPVSELSDAGLRCLAEKSKNLCLNVTGVEGFDQAQVTVGGIRTEEFDPNTLQSRLVPGLYACGEVLDIDADCGGYNLQWAWASGRLAGEGNT